MSHIVRCIIMFICVVHNNGWLRGSEGMAHYGQHLVAVGASASVRLRHPLRSVPVEGLTRDPKIICVMCGECRVLRDACCVMRPAWCVMCDVCCELRDA